MVCRVSELIAMLVVVILSYRGVYRLCRTYFVPPEVASNTNFLSSNSNGNRRCTVPDLYPPRGDPIILKFLLLVAALDKISQKGC